MDLSNPNDPLLNVAVASILTVVTIIINLMENEGNDRYGIARESSLIREQWRQAHMYRILTAGPNNCVHYLRMSSAAFYSLAIILRSNGSLHDTRSMVFKNLTWAVMSFGFQKSYMGCDEFWFSVLGISKLVFRYLIWAVMSFPFVLRAMMSFALWAMLSFNFSCDTTCSQQYDML
ncbi:Uncharacterized protein M6B38_233740 [Iris pallida]|uniref:Uncharacterized protein n=1 Tax=Iris pallida TaxID=29817 RepID=A0AAX6DQT2_IRIPA|nr:Uncharacterized protein M6B38_233740 [Iris pallida]